MRSKRTVCALVTGWTLIAANGCGDDGVKPIHADAGVAGDSGGAGTSGKAGASGAGSGSNAGRGGAAAGSGGSGGQGGTGSGGGTGGMVSIEDVDLKLGGFNQDLPAPAVDCLKRDDLIVGCLAVSGEYQGKAFDFSCEEDKILVGAAGSHIVGCQASMDGTRFDVELLVAEELLKPTPKIFSPDEASVSAYFNVWYPAREFRAYRNREFGMYQLAATHDLSYRLAGISEQIMETPPPRVDWRIEGAFALSLKPKSGCCPNAMGFGCDEVRLRANFRAFPIEQ